jgi:uncharacterized protein YnzC (UPF0291/DUF896 family)|tara:strand:- start:787 stop:1452 length:666 start_codon:yes stop_codon:yes gene_type:complete
MAENKKSFILYADLIHNIDHLNNEEKGILFQHLLEYVNDMNPVLEDRVILSSWKFIQRQLKRDLIKFEETKGERSKSGQLGNLKRYNLDLYEKVKSKSITLEEAQEIAKTRIATHSETKLAVNDNVNVNVNENVNDIKQSKIKQFNLFWNKYPNKSNKKGCEKKFISLSQKDIDKILVTIDSFITFKPFKEYNHPNPSTYLNQERWNDELEPVKKMVKYHI